MSKIIIIKGQYNSYVIVENKKYNIEYLEFYDGIIELEWEEVLIHPNRNKIIQRAVKEFNDENK